MLESTTSQVPSQKMKIIIPMNSHLNSRKSRSTSPSPTHYPQYSSKSSTEPSMSSQQSSKRSQGPNKGWRRSKLSQSLKPLTKMISTLTILTSRWPSWRTMKPAQVSNTSKNCWHSSRILPQKIPSSHTSWQAQSIFSKEISLMPSTTFWKHWDWR